MKYIISVVDTVDGAVVATSETSSLKERTFKHALVTAGVSAKGVYKADPERYVVYVKPDIGQREWSLVAKTLCKWQCIADTLVLGLEYYLFHDLYLNEYERTQLVHAGEAYAGRNEAELQDRLTAEERSLIEAIEIIREGGTPVKVAFFGDIVPVASSKYHRINKGA